MKATKRFSSTGCFSRWLTQVIRNLICAALVTTSVLFASCGGGATKSGAINISKEIDYKILGDEAELRKIYEGIVQKMGADSKFVEKLSISISRPSERGDGNQKDALQIILQQIHPTNRNKLREYMFWSSEGEWSSGQTLEIDLIGGDAASFRLEENLMDLSGLTVERLYKISQEAFRKYKSDSYSYQYVSDILIKDDIITIYIKGRLSANELVKSETYKVNL